MQEAIFVDWLVRFSNLRYLFIVFIAFQLYMRVSDHSWSLSIPITHSGDPFGASQHYQIEHSKFTYHLSKLFLAHFGWSQPFPLIDCFSLSLLEITFLKLFIGQRPQNSCQTLVATHRNTRRKPHQIWAGLIRLIKRLFRLKCVRYNVQNSRSRQVSFLDSSVSH